jgi:hypothetical protein
MVLAVAARQGENGLQGTRKSDYRKVDLVAALALALAFDVGPSIETI